MMLQNRGFRPFSVEGTLAKSKSVVPWPEFYCFSFQFFILMNGEQCSLNLTSSGYAEFIVLK